MAAEQILMALAGVRPWEELRTYGGHRRRLETVTFTAFPSSRGGQRIAEQSHQNLFGAMIHLYHRNNPTLRRLYRPLRRRPGRHRNPWHSFQ